ncbi:MFS transporter [Planococcus faecalis]|uniref:MFS transporter n=1 Tax=Planococcus faecalis TaxID=1598147 RepID=UPI00210E8F4A|nr:MFS transporter [Planococcus faecalis]
MKKGFHGNRPSNRSTCTGKVDSEFVQQPFVYFPLAFQYRIFSGFIDILFTEQWSSSRSGKRESAGHRHDGDYGATDLVHDAWRCLGRPIPSVAHHANLQFRALPVGAGMILLLQLSLLELWPLILFALCFGIVDAFFSPANTSLLPSVVAKEALPRSNSFIQSSNQIALFSGPMLGGWILSFGSFSLLFGVIAGFLLLTFLFSSLIKEEKRTLTTNRASTKSELKEGFSYVWSMPFLKNILVILIFINFFFFGPLLMGIPLLVDSVLKGKVLDLSFLQSSYQGGMLAGAVMVGVLNLRKKQGLTMLVMIGVLGIFLTLLGHISFLWQGVLLLSLMAFCLLLLMFRLFQRFKPRQIQLKSGVL